MGIQELIGLPALANLKYDTQVRGRRSSGRQAEVAEAGRSQCATRCLTCSRTPLGGGRLQLDKGFCAALNPCGGQFEAMLGQLPAQPVA